jgi:hypothetical protein
MRARTPLFPWDMVSHTATKTTVQSYHFLGKTHTIHRTGKASNLIQLIWETCQDEWQIGDLARNGLDAEAK